MTNLIPIPKKLIHLENKFRDSIVPPDRVEFLFSLEKDRKQVLLGHLAYFISMIPESMYKHFLITFHNRLANDSEDQTH